MFTGIIEELGLVRNVIPVGAGLKLEITTRICGADLARGDSLAINGCCLTVVEKRLQSDEYAVTFDVLQETWHRTNLQFCHPGDPVNLERPLRADGRLAGHFVTGHVDGIGRVRRWEVSRADRLLEVQTPPEILRYILLKGSIAVDGISLTVAEVGRDGFSVWIIPHTFAVTALSQRKVGDAVNLEGDILGKYAEKYTSPSLS